jgi:CxxC-x17-CxxC domain-containing protein
MGIYRGNKQGGRANSPKKIGSDRVGKKGSKRSFSANRGGSHGASPRMRMHSAKCESCKNICEVPFRPIGNKPVYCSNCFKGKSGDFKPSYQQGGGEAAQNYKPQFDQINHKLDRILEMLTPLVEEEVGELWDKETEEIHSSEVRKEEEVKEKPVIKKRLLKKAILKREVKKKKAAKKTAGKKTKK